MKTAFKRGFRLFRPLTLAVIKLGRLVDRLVSAARSAALFDSPTVVCHRTVEVKSPSNIFLGEHVIIGPHCTLGAAAAIRLGDHVRLSKGVIIETAGLDFTAEPPYPHISRPIALEDGVWVGARAMILGGVTVGKGSVIGAGVVVSRDVAAGSVVVGAAPRVRS